MIDVDRYTGADPYESKPMTWRPLGTPDGPSASFVCPNGHDGGLMDHTIDITGAVSPSVVCDGIPATKTNPAEGCDFHDYVRLAGWKA